MKSSLSQMLNELSDVSDVLARLTCVATVGDVAKLRMLLNRVRDAIDTKPNEEVLFALLDPPAPEKHKATYLASDTAPQVTPINPHGLVAEAEEVTLENGQTRMDVTSLIRATDLQKGPKVDFGFTGPINARLTAAAAPDLSKCTTMIIKS